MVLLHPRSLTRRREDCLVTAEIALEAGYFDHAHFTRRFATATGAPPREFFRTIEHC